MSGGRIKTEDLEALREKASIVDVAADHLKVRRVGRRFVARCPFHDEKTPSFSLEPTKNLYYCFGCHEGGDVIGLIQKLDGLDFVEAVVRLGARFGVPIRFDEASPEEREKARRRERWHEALRLAAEHFHEYLKNSDDAAPARDYLLKERAFKRETLETFEVGFSSKQRVSLVAALRAKGVRDDDIVQTNLASRNDDGTLVDRFTGRVMFPIRDPRGEVIGFGARRMGEDDGPKYLNTSETPLYKKSKVLYGLDRAKQQIVADSRAIIVEGYTDVIALHEAGLTSAVACCGTALGLEHLTTLQRFADTLTVCMDGDEAGGASAERLFTELGSEAARLGLALRVAAMPAGEDPADAVRALGPDGFAPLVLDARPLVEFVLEREAARYRRGDPQEKTRALQAGLKHLVLVTDQVIQRDAARAFADRIGVEAAVMFVELDRRARGGPVSRGGAEIVLKRSSAQVRREQDLLRFVAQHRSILEPYLPELDATSFSVPEHAAAWTVLLEGRAQSDDDPLLAQILNDARVAEVAGASTETELERYAEELASWMRDGTLQRQVDESRAQLAKLDPATDREAYDRTFLEIVRLEAERRRVRAAFDDDPVVE